MEGTGVKLIRRAVLVVLVFCATLSIAALYKGGGVTFAKVDKPQRTITSVQPPVEDPVIKVIKEQIVEEEELKAIDSRVAILEKNNSEHTQNVERLLYAMVAGILGLLCKAGFDTFKQRLFSRPDQFDARRILFHTGKKDKDNDEDPPTVPSI